MTTTPTPAMAEGEPPRECPFCGGQFERLVTVSGSRGWQSRCPGCGATGPMVNSYEDREVAWNARRPSPEGRREVLEAAEAVVKEWRHQSGRVFESMGSENPRAEAIDAKVESLAAALQATPARTGEGPLTAEEVRRVANTAATDIDLWQEAKRMAGRLDIWPHYDQEIRAIAYFLAWSQVRGSLRTGERVAALEGVLDQVRSDCAKETTRAEKAEARARGLETALEVTVATLENAIPLVHEGQCGCGLLNECEECEDARAVVADARAVLRATPPPATPLDALGEYERGRREERELAAGEVCGHQFANGSFCARKRGHRHGDLASTPTEKPPGERK